MRGLFVTGTDTGVGKTVVAAGLVRACRRRGIDAVPAKPFQTGFAPTPGRAVGDLAFCLAAAGLEPAADELALACPHIFEPACSPELAGRITGRFGDVKSAGRCVRDLAGRHDAVVVEGAGGVLVPINETETMLDLMHVLGLPVVLVARRGLGTINHTLLSLEALRGRGLCVLGVVLNGSAAGKSGFVEEDNPRAISTFGGTGVLGNVPKLPGLADDPADEMSWLAFEKALPGLPTILEELSP